MSALSRQSRVPFALRRFRRARGRASRRGVALLVVLLVTAILTIVVLDFAQSTRIDFYIASNIQNGMRAFFLAKSGVQVASGALLKDIRDNDEDHINEEWNNPMYSMIPLSDTEFISVEITDESGKFNLNHLVTVAGSVNQGNLEIFRQLLILLNLDAKVGDAIVDWIDKDSEALAGGGVEDQFYGYGSMQPSGIVVKNGRLGSLAELRMIAGVTDEVYNQLSQVCTIYSDHKYNINTIDEKVLTALILYMDPKAAAEDLVKKIVAQREGEDTYFKKGNLRQQLQDAGVDPAIAGRLAQRVATKTRYFSVDVSASVGPTVKTVHAVIERDKKKVKTIYFRPGELLKNPIPSTGGAGAAGAAGALGAALGP